MRRADREITDPGVIEEMLAGGKFATVAMCRADEPYVVTLSYGYDSAGRSLYFHCAKDGLKSEFISANPRVCATIIQDLGYVQKQCKHHYRSLVIRGEIELVEGDDDRWKGLDAMIEQLEEDPGPVKADMRAKTVAFGAALVWRLHIDEVSCKEGT